VYALTGSSGFVLAQVIIDDRQMKIFGETKFSISA
jgi:hypothetical protein